VDKPITIYGAATSGSVAVEAALTLIGLPYDLIERAPLHAVGENEAVFAVNPLRQVPAMVLPGGEVMTESAAMLIWLADRYPEARLAPEPLHRRRAGFLRWMAFVASAIYALAWIRDDPSRLVPDPALHDAVRKLAAERRAVCWRAMEAQINPGRYILGDELSVLDLYVAVISRWGPHRKRFYEVAPRMGGIVRRVDADARLATLWAERFPFREGWEG
jgi:GST-like protein